MYDITSLESFNRLKKWSTTLTEVVAVSVFIININPTTVMAVTHISKHTHTRCLTWQSLSFFQAGLSEVVTVVVGNKADLELERAVATELAEQVTHRASVVSGQEPTQSTAALTSCGMCLCCVYSLLG